MERFERQITVLDVVMVALALLSLGILVYEDVAKPPEEIRDRLYLVDLTIIGIFAVEFVFRWAQSRERWKFVKGHWYELVGMVPVAAFRAFRLARLVRIFVIASRFLRAADRTLGEAVVRRQLEKYKSIVVEELTDPIVLAVLGVTENALLKGNLGSAVAKGLRERRETVAEHILEQMRKDKALGLLLKTPGIGSAIESLPARVLEGVADTLGTKEMDDTIREVIREIMVDLRRGVKERSWLQGPAPAPGTAGNAL